VDTQTLFVVSSYFLTTIVSFSLMLVVYWQAPRNPVNISFAVLMLDLALFSAVNILGRFINDLDLDPRMVFGVSNILYAYFIGLLYVFSALFTERANFYLLAIGIFFVLFMPIGVFTDLLYVVIEPSQSDPNGFVVRYRLIDVISSIAGVIYLFFVVLRLRRIDDPRSQALWRAGLAVLVGIAMLTMRPLSTVVPTPFDTIFTLPYNALMLSVAALLMGRAVLQHQLFDPMVKLNLSLQETNAQLERSNQVREQFLAHMGHELRTPLNAIISYNTMIRDGLYGEVSDKQQDRLDRSVRNAHHLLALINEILELSKLNAGELKLQLGINDAKGLVRVSFESIASLAEDKSLPIVYDVPERPIDFVFDQQRIYQVLLNLLSNAIKFTDEGQVTLRLAVEGSKAQFSVQDTGIGIPADKLDEVFESFKQVENKKAKGTGLGLAITKQIIELHGGTIWVESEMGKGSTFHFVLPMSTRLPSDSAGIAPQPILGSET